MKTKYMIRRTLCPWNVEELVDETIEYCLKAKVDEIIWITESSGRYEELPRIERIKELIPGLLYAREKTEKAGMVFSINPLTTIGHGEYGRDMREVHPEMDFCMDFTGKVSKACACTLSPYWRQLMKDTFRLYAETKPSHLWIEDDFRYNNHGTIRFGCYCDLHLEEFAKRTGKSFIREELVSRILKPGKADPLREEWLGFLGDTLSETANMIAKEVHPVSPETHVSWMSVNHPVMDICGTDIADMMNACANGRKSGIRIHTTYFQEHSYRDMLVLDEEVKKIIPFLPESTIKCTEIETCPHSLYSKSAAGIAAQIEWSNILNITNHTINIFDYIGSPMELIPKYREMMSSRKKDFDSFAEAFDGVAEMKGVAGLVKPMMAAHSAVSKGEDMAEFAVRQDGMLDAIRAFGMPVVFGIDKPVTVVTGQVLRSLAEEELQAMFSRGVLLDGSALECLIDMGYGAIAGVEITGRCEKRSRGVGPEEMTDPDFGGGRYNYTWSYGMWPEYTLSLKDGAKMISRIVDPFGEFLFPGFVIYENKLGGRVAVCPYNLGGQGLDNLLNRASGFFYSEYRKIQIQKIIEWLSRDDVPLVVEADGWILPHRADFKDRVMLAAMNMNADVWEKISMRANVNRKVKDVSWVDINGNCQSLAAGSWQQAGKLVTVELDTEIPHLRTVAVRLNLS